VVKVTPANAYSIFAGTGAAGFTGDNAAATAATLNLPTDLYIAAGKLYIADTRNRRIRMVNLTTNVITTVAGDGTTSITGNGIGAAIGVIADGSGSIYVATGNAGNAVRKITGGTHTTIAGGNATGTYAGDNGTGSGSSLNLPADLAMYGTNLLIADEKNRRVRNLTLTTTPLSVDLLSLTATEQGQTALLQWSAVEKDADVYEIERSGDAARFVKTGMVKSNSGNQSAEASYTFTDLAPLSGQSFYRLNMINRDGRRSYSPVVSVRFGDATSTSISPVPASNQIVLRTAPGLNGSAGSIIDLQGRTVLRFTVSSTHPLDISSFAPGSYYLKLADGSTHKFIKQ